MTFAVRQKGEPMSSAENGMVRGLREFFKIYKGCRNCIHRTGKPITCGIGRDNSDRLICPDWERKSNER